MKKIIIGVSGRIGSGKTTFCKILGEYGFFHIETDRIVHDLYRRGGDGAKLVRQIFGPQYLIAGRVNRLRLRDYFLAGHSKFKFFLNKLYPFVIAKIKEYTAESKSNRVAIEFIDFDMPYFKKLIDKLIYMECSEKNILKRYECKKFPSNYIKKVIALQKKPKKIDFTVNNNLTKKHLRLSAKMIYFSYEQK